MLDELKKLNDILLSLKQPDWYIYITSAGTLLTTIILSFYIYQYIKNKKRQRYEKSLEYANQYAKDIISPISYIIGIYEKAKITDILHIIKNSELKRFDQEELNQLLDSEKQKRYANAINDISLSSIITTRLHCYLAPFPDVIDKLNLSKIKVEDREDFVKKHLIIEFHSICDDVLNNLESIAMAFRLKVADQNAVYDSLHQTFISTMHVLYCKIASINQPNENKYFTNIIGLYNLWNKKSSRKKAKRAKFFSRLEIVLNFV